ncbi:IPT/TIG domain-containing protein [Catenulispora sp. EB89]|uniref:IPT/TIG domain-containing protein n=1 Tax=Catenulispora sp. EB89 TaxID=3156257 RepID=UPI00351712E6
MSAFALVVAGLVGATGIATVTAAPARASTATTAADLAYVVDSEHGFDRGQVHVIDVATGTVANSVPVPIKPVFVVASPDKRTAYVLTAGSAQMFDGEVAVIDAATSRVTHVIGVCSDYTTDEALSPDGSRLWVECGDGEISVVDTGTDQEIKTFNVGARWPSGITFSPDGSTVYTMAWLPSPPPLSGLLVIDSASYTVTATIGYDDLDREMVLSRDGATALIPQSHYDLGTHITTHWLNVIDTAKRAITATIPMPEGGSGGVLDPTGTAAYYCADNGIAVVDMASLTVTRTLNIPCGSLSFGPDPNTLYSMAGPIYVIDVAAGKVTGSITDSSWVAVRGPAAFVRAPVIPTVAAISPAKGAEAGGGTVVVTGGPFLGAGGTTGVSFGGVPAASYTVDSDSQITAVVPPQTARTVDVTVTNDNGTSATGQADQYTYAAIPTFASMTPNSGVSSGGTSVVITGTHLSTTTAVYFGGTAASSFTIDSDTQVTAVTRAQTNGTVDVTVTNTSGTSTAVPADKFTFFSPVPIVTSVSPPSGPTTGGTTVTITGERFTGTFRVDIGGVAVPYTLDSASQITAVTPPGQAGPVDVTVTTDVGTSATGTADYFTYTTSP